MNKVDIMMGVKNEEHHLEKTLRCIARQPADLLGTVFVAVAPSTDDTAHLLAKAATSYLAGRLVVIDNPRSWVAIGLNECLRLSQSAYVARVDGHTEIPLNFLSALSAVLDNDATVAYAGPKMRTAPGRGARQNGIAVALESPIGAGPRNFRLLESSGYVDTVLLGVYRRASLDRVGLFDERLMRNQDDELHSRIRSAGERVWQEASVLGVYHPRLSFTALFKQYHGYGWWKWYAASEAGTILELKNYLPAALVASGLASVALVPWSPRLMTRWTTAYLAILTAQYATAVGNGNTQAVSLNSAGAAAAMHFGYGSGFISSAINQFASFLKRSRN